jgi:hypothetical protein
VNSTHSAPALVRTFFFPDGEDAARSIVRVRITERGGMQSDPRARPISFTSEQEIDARRSRFRWEARCARGLLRVIDAYKDGRGMVSLRAGILPMKKMSGPDFDRGELQRYLAAVPLCPPMLLHHPGLEWTDSGGGAWGLRDTAGPAGVQVDLRLPHDDGTVVFTAQRPRWLGNAAVATPWSARAAEFRDRDGMRVPIRLEAFWQLTEGPFRYYWSEITAVALLSSGD